MRASIYINRVEISITRWSSILCLVRFRIFYVYSNFSCQLNGSKPILSIDFKVAVYVEFWISHRLILIVVLERKFGHIWLVVRRIAEHFSGWFGITFFFFIYCISFFLKMEWTRNKIYTKKRFRSKMIELLANQLGSLHARLQNERTLQNDEKERARLAAPINVVLLTLPVRIEFARLTHEIAFNQILLVVYQLIQNRFVNELALEWPYGCFCYRFKYFGLKKWI